MAIQCHAGAGSTSVSPNPLLQAIVVQLLDLITPPPTTGSLPSPVLDEY